MVRIYVEGGGDHNPSLAQDVRQGFKSFFTRAGFTKPSAVIVCGSRQSAYEDYRTAIENGKTAILLVDSETPMQERYEQGDIHGWKPWEQLQSRRNQAGNQCDSWSKVDEDTDCHLMVQMMESWFLADVDAVKTYFGSGFKADKFPSDDMDIEKVTKGKIRDVLHASNRGYQKGRIQQGARFIYHSRSN